MTLRRRLSERHGSVDCGSSIGPEELALIAGGLGILRMFAPILVEEGQAGGIYFLFYIFVFSHIIVLICAFGWMCTTRS